jgi:hypothetical protein
MGTGLYILRKNRHGIRQRDPCLRVSQLNQAFLFSSLQLGVVINIVTLCIFKITK